MNLACATVVPEKNSGSYVRDIGQGLFARSLPHRLWTHEAHLAAALYLVMVRPDLDPGQVMPGLIRRYNESMGVANTDYAGFHATITEVYVRATTAFVVWLPRNMALDRAFDCLRTTPIADRKFPLHFYSTELLMSVAARRAWVEPDLRPLSWFFFVGDKFNHQANRDCGSAETRNFCD